MRLRRAGFSALWIAGLGLVVLLNLHAIGEGTARERAFAGMAGGLVALWCCLGGGVMLAARAPLTRLFAALPGGWRSRFVLGCIALAGVEEAIAVAMTNAAPVFGVAVGEAYITASTSWLDVVAFHSVVVFVPMFIALAVLLGRWDLSPAAVFLVFGTVGTLGEAVFAADPAMLLAFPMWALVYGLMVWLPARALPPAATRRARPARWFHPVLAVPAVFLLAAPLLLAIVGVIAGLLAHPRLHF